MLRRLADILRRYASLLRAIALVAGLLLALFLLRLVPSDRPLTWLKERVADLGIWGPVLYVLLYVAATTLLLPSTPIAVAGGAIFGLEVGTGLVSVALVMSAAVSFLVGRYLARDWATRKAQRYSWIRALYRALGQPGGWKIVMAVRVSHAMPFGLQNVVFGTTPIGFWSYLLATWLIMMPGAFLYAYAGDRGTEILEGASKGEEALSLQGWLLRGLGLLIAAVAVLYVGHVTRRALREEANSDPSPSDGPGEQDNDFPEK